MTMNMFDVAIVGAGPSGSAAAIGLARLGYAVTLIDKEKFPREKLCGDFINPINWRLLGALGVSEEILSLAHDKVSRFCITSFSGDAAKVPLPLRKGEALFGLGLRRFNFDHVLLKKAQSQGVSVKEGTRIKTLARQHEAWRIEFDDAGGGGTLGARLVIGADGRNSWVANQLGMDSGAARAGRSVGFQARLACPNPDKGAVAIHLFPGGYAGLVGLGDGTVNLGLAIDKRALPQNRQAEFLWESILPRNPYLKEILRRSEIIGKIHATYPVYFPPRTACGHGVLLVGDAARVNEPVTGEGIYFALKSGLLAAATIDQAFRCGDLSVARLSAYARECQRAFRFRRGVNSLIRMLVYRPALLAPFIRFSARRGRLLDAIVQAICLPETVQ